MLDLDKIKVALFDFDDTLCIHTDRPISSGIRSMKFAAENAMIAKGEGDPWPTAVTSQVMAKFLSECEKRNIHMGLLSATSNFLRAEAKIKWVAERYGVELANYCVGSAEPKVHMLHLVLDKFNIQRKEVLLVDDYYDNLEEAAAAGFEVASPMVCVAYMEQVK